MIVPSLANAFGIFFMRQYMLGIDKEFMESARIDGCTEFGIFWRIFMPMLKPTFATLGIIFFMRSWNNYLWPMILLKTQAKFVLSIAIRALDSGVQTQYNLIMAGSVVSILPLLIAFLLFQRQFIQGITTGGIKG